MHLKLQNAIGIVLGALGRSVFCILGVLVPDEIRASA